MSDRPLTGWNIKLAGYLDVGCAPVLSLTDEKTHNDI